jgi:AraC-like DNA-binding protein
LNINNSDILKAVGREKILLFIDVICGGYGIIISGVCLYVWLQGESTYQPFLGVSLFVTFNLVAGSISKLPSIHNIKPETARALVNPLVVVAAFILTIELFDRWWMAFMILWLGGNGLRARLTQKPNHGRLLIGVYTSVLLGCVFLFTNDTNKDHVMLFVGAIAMTGFLFAELLAQYLKVLDKEHAYSLQLEQQKKIVEQLSILVEQKQRELEKALEVERVKSSLTNVAEEIGTPVPLIKSTAQNLIHAGNDRPKTVVETSLLNPIDNSRVREKLMIEFLNDSSNIAVLSDEGSFLANVRRIIHRELGNERLNVDFIAREIGLSRVQLYRKMLALTGTSVSELLRSMRLQKAAKLLEQKWGPVSQVAYAVGITNLSYFSKIFKSKFGIMPSEYEGLQKHAG